MALRYTLIRTLPMLMLPPTPVMVMAIVVLLLLVVLLLPVRMLVLAWLGQTGCCRALMTVQHRACCTCCFDQAQTNACKRFCTCMLYLVLFASATAILPRYSMYSLFSNSSQRPVPQFCSLSSTAS